MKRFTAGVLSVLLAALFSGCVGQMQKIESNSADTPATSAPEASQPEVIPEPEPEPNVVTFTLTAVGDNLIHRPIYEQAARPRKRKRLRFFLSVRAYGEKNRSRRCGCV